MVAVAYDRWSFTVGFNYNKALSGKIFGVLDKWPLMWGGRIREVVAHGGSTVVFSAKTKKRFGSNVFKNPARYQLRLSGVLSIILDQIGIWQSMNFFFTRGENRSTWRRTCWSKGRNRYQRLRRTNKKLTPDEASPNRFHQCSTALAKFNLLFC